MTTSAEWAEKFTDYVPTDEPPKQLYHIQWGVSWNETGDTHVRDVKEFASKAEAMAAAEAMAHDLRESNATIWWKAEPYKEKTDTTCTGTTQTSSPPS